MRLGNVQHFGDVTVTRLFSRVNNGHAVDIKGGSQNSQKGDHTMITIVYNSTVVTISARAFAEVTNDLDRRGIDWHIVK